MRNRCGERKDGKLVVESEGKKEVWREAFARLGECGGDEGKFDEEFRVKVEAEIEEMSEETWKQVEESLDKVFEEKEVEVELRHMKNGKAGGEDEILTEMLKGGGEAVVKSLAVMFNRIWGWEVVPEQWGCGMIVPLFKEGEREDCGNYRGIALLSIVGKLFGRVLNSRLMEFVEVRELVEEQGGFRKGRGCVDVLYTWSEVVRGRRSEGLKTFCAFIDVRKAYDRVWRDGLWKRLWDAGVRGKMWRVLRRMYEKVNSCVLVDGERTGWFETKMGVRGLCVVSCVVFHICKWFCESFK